jgi:hypothetical protein
MALNNPKPKRPKAVKWGPRPTKPNPPIKVIPSHAPSAGATADPSDLRRKRSLC